MSVFKKVSDFAKSPQGKALMDKAKRYAQDPKNKKKIDDVKSKLFGKSSGH